MSIQSSKHQVENQNIALSIKMSKHSPHLRKFTHRMTKRVKFMFRSKIHRSDKKVSVATPATLHDVTHESFQPISTTSQVTNTDTALTSKKEPSPALPDDIGSPVDQSINVASSTKSQVMDTDTAQKSNNDPSPALPDNIDSLVNHPTNVASKTPI